MKSINPYLNFEGNTREVMQHYARVLGAELEIQSFGDVGMGDNPEMKDRTMHASLKKGGAKFGMLKDRYDTYWMFNFEKSR